MSFGKFEIDEFVIYAILFTIIVCFMYYMGTKETLSKEETKQLEIQQNIVYMKENQYKDNI